MRSWLSWKTAIGLVLVVVGGSALLYAYLRHAAEPGEKNLAPRKIRVGIARELLDLLPMIAQDRGFLAENGLDATVAGDYPSGKRALEGLFAGEVDVAFASGEPIVRAGFGRRDFRILANVGRTDDELRIVGQRSAGIERPEDLAGKRIGTQEGSTVERFLDLFLTKHGIGREATRIVYLPAEDLVTALERGGIDAFSMREPMVGEARRRLGEDVIVFAEPSLLLKTRYLVASLEIVERDPEALRRLLRALLAAEAFAGDRPGEAIAIVSQELGADRAVIRTLWSSVDARVLLDQPVLADLDEVARWILDRGLVPQAEAPNYLEFLHRDALAAVAPRAMKIRDWRDP